MLGARTQQQLQLQRQPAALMTPTAAAVLPACRPTLGAHTQRAQDAVQLLSLAVLLSSTFVFNQMGPIDEAALDRLSLVTQITNHVRVRATGAAAGAGSAVAWRQSGLAGQQRQQQQQSQQQQPWTRWPPRLRSAHPLVDSEPAAPCWLCLCHQLCQMTRMSCAPSLPPSCGCCETSTSTCRRRTGTRCGCGCVCGSADPPSPL